MKNALLLLLLLPTFLFSQAEEILKKAREKLEKIDQVTYRSTIYFGGGMGGDWYCDGQLSYEKRNNNHLVYLKHNTDLLIQYFSNEQKQKLTQRLPPHTWFAVNPNESLPASLKNLELQLNSKHRFGKTKQIIYNGNQFVGIDAAYKMNNNDSDFSFLRERTHLMVLDLLKGLQKKGKVLSYVEEANTHRFVLEGRWPKGSLRSDQVTFDKARRIELLLDKKELFPQAVFFVKEWGLLLCTWDDYKFDVAVDETIWQLEDNIAQDKWRYYEDENGVIETYQLNEKQVFYKGKVLPNCDPKSFRHLGKYYFRDASKVYYGGKVMVNADPETLDTENDWPRDKNQVYTQGKAIVGADPNWFGLPDSSGQTQRYNYGFLSDGITIYANPGIPMQEADIESFEVLQPMNGFDKFFNMDWARDKNHVYYTDAIVENADPETIVVLNQYHAKDKEHYIMGAYAFKNDADFVLYPNLMAKNKEGVYLKNGRSLIHADPESFSYLNEFFQKDKAYVFCEGKELLDADAATFKVVGEEGFGHDKNLVFFKRRLIETAEANSWQFIEDYYSKDRKNVFYWNKKVKGADVATFKVVDLGKLKIGEDKNGKYIGGRSVTEAMLQKIMKKK